MQAYLINKNHNVIKNKHGISRTGTGILPWQSLNSIIKKGEITSSTEISPLQIQPASLDLRLGACAYRVRASFLPGKHTSVEEKIAQCDGYKIDLRDSAVLEKGCVYVIPLLESLKLRTDLAGFANPKSSTGRLDVLARLITDKGTAFDQIERGYKGPLYVEVAPRTFSVVVRTGTCLNQLRLRRGSPSMALDEFRALHEERQIVSCDEEDVTPNENKMLRVTADLRGANENALIGFRAKKHTDRIDLENIGFYHSLDFWEPIYADKKNRLILDPDAFYILATREAIGVPADYAAEMVAYDTTVGEFRVHYAGFFDPGFGWNESTNKAGGSKAVLEVRSHEVPFLLEHGQTVGWLRYERMSERPEKLYGSDIRSNYQNQGLKLAKQFTALI